MVTIRAVVAPVTATSWRVKPTELNTSVLFSGTLSEKLPSPPVLVPMLVPFTSTVTPGRPSPLACATRPDTITSCTAPPLVRAAGEFWWKARAWAEAGSSVA